jgi:hypothetical protein
MKKKIAIYTLISFFVIITIYFFRLSIYELMPKNVQSVLRILLSNKINTLRLDNDYNTKFLPETQFTYIKYKKVKLKSKNLSKAGYGNYLAKTITSSFYIDIHSSKIIISFKNGDIHHSEISNFIEDKYELNKIKSNLDGVTVLDMLVHQNSIYISAAEKISDDCFKLSIFKSKVSYENLNFKKKTVDENCYQTIQSGRMQYSEKLDGLLIGTAANILKFKDQSDEKPQNDNSLMGKIIFLDFKNDKKTIFSKGHRNILGLLAFDNYILATENGPKGGDEINLIKKGENYGWPKSSYGEKYNSISTDKIFYLKNHEKHGFMEPIYSFIPSIGITEIIKLDNNFSKYWQESFLIGSLNSRHLYRVNFDENYKKIKFIEKIYIGERIRDLKYSYDKKLILLALEDTGSVGVLSIN